jgi:hypothetical protein
MRSGVVLVLVGCSFVIVLSRVLGFLAGGLPARFFPARTEGEK